MIFNIKSVSLTNRFSSPFSAPLVGIDNDGGMCRVRIVKKESGDIELYVDYNDFIWAYSVYKLD